MSNNVCDIKMSAGLYVKCLNSNAKQYYTTNEDQIVRGDSGYDLYYCGDDDLIVEPFKKVMVGLGIACQPFTDHGYELYARSSISKTPLMLANGVGIIDIGYRGEIMAPVKNFSQEPYTIVKGSKLFQLCMHDKKAFPIILTEELSETVRGEGGFGSTNK